MGFVRPDDPAVADLVRRYVVWSSAPDQRRYLRLFHGGALGEDRAFLRALAEDARRITDEELGRLLTVEWRSRLTAAWLIGLDRRTVFRRLLGELLLESELMYSGQAYCFALARFGGHEDADLLAAYLDRYLPRRDCYYDQHWAIGALLYLDDRLGGHRAARFLGADGLWARSATRDLDPAEYRRVTGRLCALADDIHGAGGDSSTNAKSS
ncbi:hypothetical protein GCM10023191_055010 [Actinoallomurus oryzae]|uniref:Uncharacterized protein n=1 Tax=Actinoallomurus oryzae TaxID=502180 RepID=A0ABP8QGA3_9ACTN